MLRDPQKLATEDAEAYEQLQFYTLDHGGPEFVHQHLVDARAAQTADDDTKPIGLVFALIGLCLRVEHGFSGRQVQKVHMQLARRPRDWPSLPRPRERGQVTARQVLAAPAGTERDAAIDQWCASVWDAYAEVRPAIVELLHRQRILPPGWA